jgi:putative transposase
MAKPQFKSNKNVVYSCKYHLVWCPKYRRKVLTPPIAERLRQIVHELANETGCEVLELEVLELEVLADHVHLLCEVDPQFGIAKFVRLVKGRTWRYLRQEFPELKSRLPTLWTNSYFLWTVGGAPLWVVKQYIEQQKNR